MNELIKNDIAVVSARQLRRFAALTYDVSHACHSVVVTRTTAPCCTLITLTVTMYVTQANETFFFGGGYK